MILHPALRRTVLVIGVVVLLGLLMTGVPVAAQPPDDAQPIGIIDGDETVIKEGSIVGRATLQDSKCIVDAPIKVGARVPNGNTALAISWRFDEQCQAVVYDIRPVQEAENALAQEALPEDGQFHFPTPDSAPNGSDPTQGQNNPDNAAASTSAERRAGWVKHTILEQFDVTATEVYAHLYYWQNDDSVWGGHDPYAYCYHSAFPGWTIEDCFSVYFPYGPDYVWIEVTGEFHHTLNIDYTQYAQWYGTPYGYSYTCDLTEGALPIFWEERCVGGKVNDP